ncbi:unnamed protein product, partial [Ectocarpus sp. 4 AP-2014]
QRGRHAGQQQLDAQGRVPDSGEREGGFSIFHGVWFFFRICFVLRGVETISIHGQDFVFSVVLTGYYSSAICCWGIVAPSPRAATCVGCFLAEGYSTRHDRYQ